MYSLDVIKSMNARAAQRRPVENEITRHCSFCQSSAGVVLHSAKRRSTGFLRGRAASAFVRRWNRLRSAAKRDQLVESYF